jgi:hypothetical protein
VLAETFNDLPGWHGIANLVAHGCAPEIAQ